MRPFLKLALAGLCMTAVAQAQQADDPANLKGERVQAQDPADTLAINHGAAALQQLLLKLRTRASMMFIVAHPDDEDGGLLTYESRGQGARVAMLTLTRGEGGQNLMSADFDDALGLIRTQELLAEDRYTGVDQFFGTEVDFGFSKTKEEAFAKWTHERVLYDAVRAVRLYRPLVLASVFMGGPTDGHGQHQVSGEICQEVFTAAADPKVFPEMGLPPWVPLRVYARVPFARIGPDGMFDYATGRTIPTRFHNYVTGVDTTREPVATVSIHEGDPAVIGGKPALGMEGLSYVQFARKGLALQKTQIGGNVRLAPAGRSDSGYALMGSRMPCDRAEPGCAEQPVPARGWGEAVSATRRAEAGDDLFAGIDTSLPALVSPADSGALRADLQRIDDSLAEAQRVFDPAKPEATVRPLREALRVLDSLIYQAEAAALASPAEKFDLLHELRVKHVQLNDALVLAYGLKLEVVLAPQAGAPAGTDPFATATAASVPEDSAIQLIARVTVGPTGVNVGSPTANVVGGAPQSDEYLRKAPLQNLAANSSADFHFTLEARAQPDEPYFSRPNTEQPFYDMRDPRMRNAPQSPGRFRFRVAAGGVELYADATALGPVVEGRLTRQRLAVVPAVQFSVDPANFIVTHETREIAIQTSLSNPARVPPTLELVAPGPWFHADDVVKARQTDEASHVFYLYPPSDFKVAGSVRVQVKMPRHTLQQEYRPVGYAGLPTSYFYTDPVTRIVPVDVTTAPNVRVAYLPGTGDAVPVFLPNLGVTPTLITTADLTPAGLAEFDTVVLGVRAYAAHPELAGKGSQPLLDFAARGGVVIVQYNTARYGDAEAPYPISSPGDSAHNVVEEAQPVRLVEPEAALLTWPNRITSADFDGWVAERGHGFAASWDGHYHALLETHDVDQDPQRGGLLVAPVGKGAYIYCALALYRQLPEAVPGAYRLMANLLSYAKNLQR